MSLPFPSLSGSFHYVIRWRSFGQVSEVSASDLQAALDLFKALDGALGSIGLDFIELRKERIPSPEARAGELPPSESGN
jgi:hypothetical protein